MSYTDSNTYSLHPRDRVDTWGVHGYSQATPNNDNFKKDHHLTGTNDWQAQTRQKSHATEFKGRRRNETILAVMSQWIIEHQIGLAINLLLLLAMTHMCFHRARRHTRKFFQLSYHNPSTGKYTLGQDDIFMVSYWIIVLTGLRAAVMDYVLAPIAQAAGVEKKNHQVRFTEQAWVLIYSSVFFSLGMFLMYHSNYWLDLRQLWAGWPDRELSGLFKWYYLVQFAFWVQQILVVNIEKRRKDHIQMFTHHIITCALMFTSYGYHQAKVGNLILCLMDVVDLVFAIAKILKYLQFQLICDIAFGVFMVSWFVARQVIYMLVCYSVYAHIPEEITYGCYFGPTSDLKGPIPPPNMFNHLIQPFRDPEGLVCWDGKIKWTFLSVLLVLQVLMLMWFVMIIKVAYKVIRGGEAEDSRSDDEEEDEEEDDEIHDSSYEKNTYERVDAIEVSPLEEEVGVEAINLSALKRNPSRRFRKGGGTASGVTIPSDRKELLGRIGCDKGS